MAKIMAAAAVIFIGILSLVHGQEKYYGKLIQSGWTNPSHGLSGEIYAVDGKTFQIIGFTYRTENSSANFVLGTDKAYDGTIDPTAKSIPNPTGQSSPLRDYTNEDVQLTLPSGTQLPEYKYIAICDSTTCFGGATIPANFAPPAAQVIGKFSTHAHSVTSGDVIVLNDRTIEIKSLRYDGQGPDAFFYVGITPSVSLQSSPYGAIPDENGVVSRKARAYADKDIVLTLPEGVSATKLKWLSIYCISYQHNFGEVFFPDDLNVPPYSEIKIDRGNMNCEPLSDKLQVAWEVNTDSITFELAGSIDRNKDYMAFGLSGSEDTFKMINADVVVADWKEDRQPRALDYFIDSYAQCAPNGGACPDTSSANAANDDVMMTTGEMTNGILRVKYTRALVTNDSAGAAPSKDKAYKLDGTSQQIVWAIGPLNSKDETAKHYPGDRINVAKTINFARAVEDNCPPFALEPDVIKPDFTAHHLYGDEGTVFTAEIGQAASEQGYLAITGLTSWGIAWYINGILVPELHLKRGVPYTFRIGGGTNPAAGAQYHPFYFTDDLEGGYQQTSNGTIFPGKVDGSSAPYAIGGYCEWKLTSAAVDEAAEGKIYQCFEQFRDDLYLDCLDDSPSYTDFVWTADENTPDTLYYQCYTHKNLGWKVHIYDELPAQESRKTANDCTVNAANLNTVSLLTAVIYTTARYIMI